MACAKNSKKTKLIKKIDALKNKVHLIIEGTDTRAGRVFDLVLLVLILGSVLVVMLDSVLLMRLKYGDILHQLEWLFTFLFTLEYALRVFSAPSKRRYVLSFFGIVDLISVLPAYLSFFFGGLHYLIVVRILRLLRVFRVLKLQSYLHQAGFLTAALKTSRHKIAVFFLSLSLLVIVFGAVLYVVEGAQNGFTSIPLSIYWAIVTLTTVGYGDVSPKTPIGQAIASLVMITGYSIIAVPTGIFTAELSKSMRPQLAPIACPSCGKFGHAMGAIHCDRCGAHLHL